MKRPFTLLGASLTALVAVVAFVVAWKVFGVTHAFVTDSVGDTREMRGDGPQPEYWKDFSGYIWLYLPSAILGALSVSCAAVAGVLFKRVISGQPPASNTDEAAAADREQAE